MKRFLSLLLILLLLTGCSLFKKDDPSPESTNDDGTEELETVAVDGVDGAYISIGSLDEISTSGNWPPYYDNKK